MATRDLHSDDQLRASLIPGICTSLDEHRQAMLLWWIGSLIESGQSGSPSEGQR